MTGPQDPAAGGYRLRAGHADRERAIDTLKDAYVYGRLTRDEYGVRASEALAARTCAELAALTADIPVAGAPAYPAMAGSGRPSAPARRRPMAKAVAVSGPCLAIAFAAVWIASHLDNPFGPSPYKSWIPLCLVVAGVTVFTALIILGYGAGVSFEQKRSRRQLPPPPRTSRRSQEGGRRGGVSDGPVPPAAGIREAPGTELRVHTRRRHVRGQACRPSRDASLASGAV